MEDSIAAIENYISSEWDGGNAEIELVAEVVEPRGSEEDLEQITDMMGSYTTNYKDSRSEPLRQHLQCNQQDQWYTALSGRGIFRL